MGRIIVEYNPPLLVISQKLIKDNITPSMTSNDNTSHQYDIDMIAECLQANNLQIDYDIVDTLRNDGVNYIEISE